MTLVYQLDVNGAIARGFRKRNKKILLNLRSVKQYAQDLLL